ncbi:hypothetical protein [Kocuria sp. CPCC 205297]|uniref:hypothetical protein n=1 Tax=Kocuria sp. CPCC 205297 TaxID=3073558 RepID=UPI0034D647A5
MTAHTSLPVHAGDKKAGLTVADLILWTRTLQDLDVDPRSTVRARVGFRGQLLEVVPRPPEEPRS